jgi:hypothetical protein
MNSHLIYIKEGHAAAGSGPAEDGGLLWVVKIRSAHFLRRGSKAVRPMSYIYGMRKNPAEWDALSAKFPEPCFSNVIPLLRYQMAVVVESDWFLLEKKQ